MSSPFVLAVDPRAVDLALKNYLAHPEEGAGELLRFARELMFNDTTLAGLLLQTTH